jgi:hypothetical protein
MGYRSEVVIAITKKAQLEASLKDSMPSLLLSEWCETEESEDVVYYRITDIKWHDSYDDIAEVIKFLEGLEDQTHLNNNLSDQPYGFIRVGEDSGDIEEEGDLGAFDIHTDTAIFTPLD